MQQGSAPWFDTVTSSTTGATLPTARAASLIPSVGGYRTQMTQKKMALERSAKALAGRCEELLEQFPDEWVGVTTAPDDCQPLVFSHANRDALHWHDWRIGDSNP